MPIGSEDGSRHLLPQPVPLAAAQSTIAVPLDIVLLQDETGSMSDDIGALRALAPQIWDSVAGIATAGFRMSVVGFRDFARSPWGNSGDWVYRLIVDFTSDRDAFVAAVSSLTAAGGNDTPEGQYAALYYLLTPSHPCIDSNGDGDCLDLNDTPANQQPSFRSGAKRIILLATDAPFHDPEDTPGYPGPEKSTVISALMANRVIVIGLVPGGAGRLSEVDEITSITGGTTQDTGSSGQDIADAILAALGEVRPVSPDLSTIQAYPTSAPSDGFTTVTITVTLRDTANHPVANKVVLLYSDLGGVEISQPLAPTDGNGQAIGVIRSLTPGTATIAAVDVTDGVQITQRATVLFTGVAVPPSEELRLRIYRLDEVSRRELGHLGLIAQEAGVHGDYFRGAIGADKARMAIDGIFGATSIFHTLKDMARPAIQIAIPGVLDVGWYRIDFVVFLYPNRAGYLFNTAWRYAIQSGDFWVLTRPILEDGARYYANRLLQESIKAGIKELIVLAFRKIASSSSGLSEAGNFLAADVVDLQTSLAIQRDQLVSGIPPMSAEEQSAYAEDLRRRTSVPVVLSSAQNHQAMLLSNLRAAHNSVGGGWEAFVLKFIAKTLAQASFDGPGVLVVEGVTTGIALYIDARKLDAAQRAYATVPSVLKGSAEAAARIYSNATAGYERITRRLPTRPVTGAIEGVRHYSQGSGWGPFWKEHVSYSDITLKNTSSEKATFEIIVQYGYDSRLFGLPWAYIPLISSAAAVVNPGEAKTVRVYYKQEAQGGSPSKDSNILIDVIASNDTGTFYIGRQLERWNPERTGLSGLAVPASAVAEDALTIENPIDVYVFGDPVNQIYQAQIWVANPLTRTITVNVTQTLPSGTGVVATDGIVGDSHIIWQKMIMARDIVSLTFSFRYSGLPGSSLNLPPATMAFVEPNSGLVLTTQSNAPVFIGLWPVTVEGYAPLGAYGGQSSMPITVTNLLTESVSGSLTVVISDTIGAPLYTDSRSFNIPQKSASVLTFTLPGQLSPGLYPLDVWLTVNGSTERVLADTYYVRGSTTFLPTVMRNYGESVTYNWLDATNGGTIVAQGDDTYQYVSLPFPFRFYGNTYTGVYVSSNGFVSFGSGYTNYRNSCIPSTDPPNNAIYAFWADLVPTGGSNGNIYVKQTDNDTFVIEWYR
ncbi:MAG: invasin domain 3-containing protein, partial [Candidatus Methanomethyliaceae archaeon]